MRIGTRCEVRPAFNSETSECDRIDEWTYSEVFVVMVLVNGDINGDVDVETRDGRETRIHVGRLRPL